MRAAAPTAPPPAVAGQAEASAAPAALAPASSAAPGEPAADSLGASPAPSSGGAAIVPEPSPSVFQDVNNAGNKSVSAEFTIGNFGVIDLAAILLLLGLIFGNIK